MRSWRARIGDQPVVLAEAGLGKVNTALLAGILAERHRPRLLLFTGVAGGLDPERRIGDVVIGERTVQHDTGVLSDGGSLRRYQPGHVPFFNPTNAFGFSPTMETLERVRMALSDLSLEPVLGRRPRVVFGTIATGDQFIDDQITRERLHRELKATAVDMESGALAQAALNLETEHLVIRSLSDLAGSGAVSDFQRFAAEAAANSARIVLEVLPVL